MSGIRYRVTDSDPRFKDWVESGPRGPISSEGTPEEIVERLQEELGAGAFDAASVLEWLETQASGPGGPATLPLNESQQLEVVV